jgi:hypothetical protein
VLAAGAGAAADAEPSAARGERLAGLDRGRLLGLMQDRTSSHLMEARPPALRAPRAVACVSCGVRAVLRSDCVWQVAAMCAPTARQQMGTARRRWSHLEVTGIWSVQRSVCVCQVDGFAPEKDSAPQVVASVAPAELLEELHARFLRGQLAGLAAHPCANFVVQALAGAATTPQQARAPRGGGGGARGGHGGAGRTAAAGRRPRTHLPPVSSSWGAAPTGPRLQARAAGCALVW